MERREITPQHLESVLEIFAVACLGSERFSDINNNEEDFPFIRSLFWMEPKDLVDIFHNGSLMHDLQRVGGVNWSWNVGLVGDQLQIRFYKNKPFREKTQEELQAEDDLNNQIAEYLNQR